MLLMLVIVRFYFGTVSVVMRVTMPMQFHVAVVTRIVAVLMGMTVFMRVSMVVRVRMNVITVSVFVGMLVHMLV
jgi:hypothetical protein